MLWTYLPNLPFTTAYLQALLLCADGTFTGSVFTKRPNQTSPFAANLLSPQRHAVQPLPCQTSGAGEQAACTAGRKRRGHCFVLTAPPHVTVPGHPVRHEIFSPWELRADSRGTTAVGMDRVLRMLLTDEVAHLRSPEWCNLYLEEIEWYIIHQLPFRLQVVAV